MSDSKTDNELLEEILFHTKETRKSTTKIQGNTFLMALAVVLSVILSLVAASKMM